MNIVLLGSDERFINELSELISKKINFRSARSCFDMHEFFQNPDVDWIDVLFVEINTT